MYDGATQSDYEHQYSEKHSNESLHRWGKLEDPKCSVYVAMNPILKKKIHEKKKNQNLYKCKSS